MEKSQTSVAEKGKPFGNCSPQGLVTKSAIPETSTHVAKDEAAKAEVEKQTKVEESKKTEEHSKTQTSIGDNGKNAYKL